MVYSFSVKPTDVDGKFEIDLLKSKCEKEGWNFSAMIIKLIKEFNNDQRRTKN